MKTPGPSLEFFQAYADFMRMTKESDFPTTLHIKRLSTEDGEVEGAVPTRAHPTDAGLDLYAVKDYDISVMETVEVQTGIAVALPPNTVGLVCPRSGWARDLQVTVGNAPGVIDEGYRGEVKVLIRNNGLSNVSFQKGTKVAQLLVVPIIKPDIVVVDLLPEGDRGNNGFGSTGS